MSAAANALFETLCSLPAPTKLSEHRSIIPLINAYCAYEKCSFAVLEARLRMVNSQIFLTAFPPPPNFKIFDLSGQGRTNLTRYALPAICATNEELGQLLEKLKVVGIPSYQENLKLLENAGFSYDLFDLKVLCKRTQDGVSAHEHVCDFKKIGLVMDLQTFMQVYKTYGPSIVGYVLNVKTLQVVLEQDHQANGFTDDEINQAVAQVIIAANDVNNHRCLHDA